ncbi:MAG: hypothetical protein JSS07_08695 [Proteobacteria bacterium]|nr:hypothetical protein [Pseudomonadota bacterium]
MEKSSEGVVINSLDSELGELSRSLKKLNSLPKQARLQFIKDIKQAIGLLDDPHLPASLKPILTCLINNCSDYLNSGIEAPFMLLCEEAIEQCGQGWSHLSYWICSEQALCYNLFWSLKDALDKHRKQLSMYHNCCNDGAPRLQFYRLPIRTSSK